MSRSAKIICVLAVSVFGTACTSVKMPDIPGFDKAAAEAENLDYLNPVNAPAAPDDIRSDDQWDNSAKRLINQRDRFSAPPDVDGVRSEQALQQDIAALKAKVKEYKLDDPVE